MDGIAEALRRREVRYSRTQERRIQNVDEERAFVDRVGFCFLWPIKGIEMPSLFHAIAGRVCLQRRKVDPPRAIFVRRRRFRLSGEVDGPGLTGRRRSPDRQPDTLLHSLVPFPLHQFLLA